MKTISKIILFFIFINITQNILASAKEKKWNKDARELCDSAFFQFSTSQKIYADVLKKIESHNPHHKFGKVSRTAMKFRDLYLNSPSIQGLIRSLGLSTVLGLSTYYFDIYNEHQNLEEYASILPFGIHAYEATMEIFREAHKLPYRSLLKIRKTEAIRSLGTIAYHLSRAWSFGLVLSSGGVLFSVTGATLESQKDYLDVVLRSLERYYKKSEKTEHLAFVKLIQAQKLLNKNNNSEDETKDPLDV